MSLFKIAQAATLAATQATLDHQLQQDQMEAVALRSLNLHQVAQLEQISLEIHQFLESMILDLFLHVLAMTAYLDTFV